MKKQILSAAIAIIFLFSGCAKVSTVTSPTNSGNTNAPPTANAAAAASLTPPAANHPSAASASAATPSATGDSTTPQYSITTATFSQDKIHIEYPQIKGLGDDKKEKTINDLIKNDIWNSAVNVNIQQDLTLDLKYQVMMSTNKLLSIMYTGSVYIKGGIHPDHEFFGCTIDLNNIRKLYLSDFTTIDNSLAQKILQSTAVTNDVVKNETGQEKQNIIQELISEIQREDDVNNLIWGLKDDSEEGYYITPNSLVVSLGISHASGDYALVEILGCYTKRSGEDSTYDNYLSLDAENLLVSFKLENSTKTVSVCISKGNDPYIAYRFGTKGKIDFQFPVNEENSWNNFTYSISSDQHSNYLSFINAGYKYQVYQEYVTESYATKIGVKVTDLSSGNVTDIKGISNSLIGNLAVLSYGEYDKYIKGCFRKYCCGNGTISSRTQLTHCGNRIWLKYVH